MGIASERELVDYQSDDGSVPFREWLDKLRDDRAVARVEARLARVRLGNFGDSSSVGDGVSELRVDCGPGYRVYYGLDGPRLVLLLCGGDKSSQKSDIKQAKEYWSEYTTR